jgi:D-lactate dehydrogenase (cytochrome)
MHPSLVADLRLLLAAGQVSTLAGDLDQHARGESFDAAVRPDVVLYPESAEDVATIVTYAAQHRVPVTPVAVNSSLEGHTVPLHGGISLDMGRMNRILEFRPDDLLIVVEPAVTYPQINAHVRQRGLFFPVDPGAHASIGGMVGTNASGTAAVRYGVTADHVLGLEIVTGTGERMRLGSRARKSSSGYPLARLLCGSEGTLGVVTEVTLRLTGLPEAASAARVPFPDTGTATQYVTALTQAGVPVARCELIDVGSIAAINAHQGTAYPPEPTIFLEFHGGPAGVAGQAALAEELAFAMGATAFESSTDPAERDRLWEARHNLYYALVAASPQRRNVSTDVAVPISELPAAMAASLDDCRREGLLAYALGHVGDGNFHLAIFFDTDEEAEAVARVSHAMVLRALQVGGTSTGEHGVGLRKLGYMEAEHGPALELMRGIKRVFDPHRIMNPGKKIPD